METKNFGYLRPVTDEDQHKILAWRNDPNIRRMMYTQHEITQDEHNAWWQHVRNLEEFQTFMYVHDEIETGFVSFSQISRTSGTAFWAFYARPNAPRGTGSKMEFLALEQAFSKNNLRKLNCEVIGKNFRVVQLHKSFGFQQEGLFLSHILIGDEFENVHRLAIHQTEWEKIRQEKYLVLSERFLK